MGMLGKEKLKIVLGVSVSILFIFTFIEVTKLKKEKHDLIVRLDYLEKRLQSERENISNIQQEFTNKINEATSILDDVHTKAVYEDQKMYIDVFFEPKELRNGEKVFVKFETSNGSGKIEALKNETEDYFARIEVKLDNEARITVIFETDNSSRQQSLEPININEMFAFGVESHWGAGVDWMDAEEQEITITVTPQSETSKNFNIKPEKVELIILDWNGKEVGREQVKKVSLDSYGDIYRCKLGEYFGQEGGYNTVFEMTTEEGIKYSSNVGGFDIYENEDIEYRTNAEVIYPKW